LAHITPGKLPGVIFCQKMTLIARHLLNEKNVP